MDRELLSKAGIDVADGTHRCGDSPQLYERLLGMFLADDNYEASKVDIDSHDWDALFSHVHELKGVSGNLSMSHLYESSSRVVALLRAEDYDAVPVAYERMAADYHEVVNAIKAAM